MALAAVPPGGPDGRDRRDAGRRRGPRQAVGLDGRPEGGRRGDPLPARPRPPHGALPRHPVLDPDQPAARGMAGGPARRPARRCPTPVQCGWTPRSGYQAGQALAADPEVTAVLCGNDDLALGVMRAMHEAGRAIPGEVSVVGFDDTPVGEVPHAAPDHGAAGLRRTGPVLLRPAPGTPGAGGPARPRARRPEPELIIRESAGPPPLCRAGQARPARQPLDARHRKGSIL